MTQSPSVPNSEWHHHQAFGLRVRTMLRLPELLPADAIGAFDIEVIYDEVPAELPDALSCAENLQASRDQLLLKVDGVASYLVSGGQRVTIARDPAADDDDVRVFLLGSVFGALLHQRDDLVLHGSAIEWEGECVAFLGFSGVGKSTLASAFRKRGHAVLTDDLCVVRPRADGRMVAYPGFPQTKLWLDSLQQLDVSAEGLRRIHNKLEKRAVPLAEAFATAPLPVKKLYLLRPHHKDGLNLSSVDGPRKFGILRNHTYRFGFLAALDGKAGHFQQALKLAQQAPVSIVVRPSNTFCLDELVAMIETDLRR